MANLEEIHKALLSAFPDHGDLDRFVEFKLEESLNQLAHGGKLPDTVFGLCRWAEAHGRLDELILAAVVQNPTNPKLRAVLPEVLVRLYSSPVAISRVTFDAGLVRLDIDFQGPTTTIWESVLHEAVRQDRLTRVVEAALREYRTSPKTST
jgi:hypothetical protein